jgi:nucleoside recognition membrane protein YjiH
MESSVPVKFTPRTLFRLIVYSAFGVFAFFINVPFPAYTIPFVNGPVVAQSTILVNHLVNFVKGLLWWGDFKAMPFVVLLIGVYGVVDLYVRRDKHFRTPVAIAFSIFKIIGMGILVMIVFNIGPAIISAPLESLGNLSISQFILNNILISICISIPAAALFLPFLLDYGLVDFAGVLLRPVMRPVFLLPGRAAVIMVSAFLGNFSVGHIAVNDQYKSGRMTERESFVIGSSLSTVSVGFLMVLATNTHLMSYWNTYFWTAFLITLLVTLVGVRIPPLRGVPDSHYPGATPTPEAVYKTGLWRNAFKEAVYVAENAESPARRMLYFQKETIGVLGTVATGTSFFATFGVLLYTFTPLFRIVGYVFYPLVRLFVPGSEALTASTGAAISFLEVTIPALLVTTGEWTLRIRYMMAMLPVTAIIFLASFVPCLMGTEVPVKFWHLIVIWIERMFLSILFVGVFAVLLFPAGAV